MLEPTLNIKTGNKVYPIASKDNYKLLISILKSLKNNVESLENDQPITWEANKLIEKNRLVIYDDYIWRCETTCQDSEFIENKYTKIGDDLNLITKEEIESILGLSSEEIETLSKIILDSEVRLDKTWSSSKIYTDLQQCLNDSKTYTLEQLAKKTGASYKIVSNTTDMESTEYLYLLANENNAYDIYAVIDSMPQKIGDTNIDLSLYAKLTDLDNYYDKTTSDGKYATITTVNNHISDNVAHLTQTERDNLLTKNKITTTIDENSTDNDIPSAKAVFDNLFKSDNSITDYTSGITKGTYVTNLWTTSLLKIGKLVNFNINITVDVTTEMSYVNFGKIPKEVRPAKSKAINCVTNNNKGCYVYVDSNGNFGLRLMSANEYINKDGCRICICYLTE